MPPSSDKSCRPLVRGRLGRLDEAMTTEEFQAVLQARLALAQEHGERWIDINSGELHRSVGGYPGPDHRMPACRDAMYREEKAGDEILSKPGRGKGASLTIRYRLPR